ncbi:hypothetical protein RUND412_004976, partial [Rhizina undulata]
MNRSPATPPNPQTPGGAVSGPSTRRIPVRRTPGAGRLNPPSSKLAARSPHVVKAFEQRRALTPGRERRKSGRYATARETPRDLLRALSRQLKTTEPYQPTPGTIIPPTPHRAKTPGSSRRSPDVVFYNDLPDDDDDDDRIQPPRLSLDLNYDPDDDEERIPPPRLSLPLEDFDVTNQSIEFGRRAVSEQPVVGRASFGIRLSDRFEDFNELGARAMGDWEREDEA